MVQERSRIFMKEYETASSHYISQSRSWSSYARPSVSLPFFLNQIRRRFPLLWENISKPRTWSLSPIRFPSYTQALTLHIRFFRLSFFFLVYCTLSSVYLLFTLYLTTHILTICNITMKRTRLCLTVILKLGLCGPRNSVKCELLKTSFLDNLCYVARCFSNSCLAPARII